MLLQGQNLRFFNIFLVLKTDDKEKLYLKMERFTCDSIEEASSECFFTMKRWTDCDTTPGQHTAHLASVLHNVLEKVYTKELKWNTPVLREKQCMLLHQIPTNFDVKRTWDDVVSGIDVPVNTRAVNMLYQYVIDMKNDEIWPNFSHCFYLILIPVMSF